MRMNIYMHFKQYSQIFCGFNIKKKKRLHYGEW
jgi:hypothetical protein